MFQGLHRAKLAGIIFFACTCFFYLMGLGRYQIFAQGKISLLTVLSGAVAPIRIASVDGEFVTLRDIRRTNRLLKETGEYGIDQQIDYTTRMTAFNQLRDEYSLRAVCDDFLKLRLEDVYSDEFSLCLSELEANIHADSALHAETKQEIDQLYQRVQDGESIALIASQKSDDISAESAGDIGYVSEYELMGAEAMWFNIAFGELSEVIEREDDFAFVAVYDVHYDGADKNQVGLYLVTKKKKGVQEVIDGKEVRVFVESRM